MAPITYASVVAAAWPSHPVAVAAGVAIFGVAGAIARRHGSRAERAVVALAALCALAQAPCEDVRTKGLVAVVAVGAAALPPAGALAFAVAAGLPTPPGPPGEAVVIVTVDALRCDTGRAVLADVGPVTCVSSPAPWTLPALASLHTGREPWDLPAGTRAFLPVPPTAITLAERARAAGFRTVAISGGNPFTGRRYGLDQGFDEIQHPWSSHRYALCAGTGAYGTPRPALARWWRRPMNTDAAALLDQARRALHEGGDVLLWVHLMDLHLPLAPLPLLDRPTLLADPSPERVAMWRAAYAGEAERLGGRLAEFARTLPPDTTLVITADHGERFTPPLEHGGDLSDELLLVPLVTRRISSPPQTLVELGIRLALRFPGAPIPDPPPGPASGDVLYGPGAPSAPTDDPRLRALGYSTGEEGR